MNTTTTKLMAALIAITALAPAPALAAESVNPYTVKLSNGVCTFGIDLNNPEARFYSQDRGYVNQSYVLDKIAKEVPEFAPVWAANPRLENKLTDPGYRVNWEKAVVKLKAAGYTDNDIMWIDRVLHKRGMLNPLADDTNLSKPLPPKEARRQADMEPKGIMQHYAAKLLYYNIEEDGKIALFQYWSPADKPLPELSEKITDKASGEGHLQLVKRARDFAGYQHDILEECAKLGGFGAGADTPSPSADKSASASGVPTESTATSSSQPASDSMFSATSQNRKPGGALGMIYRIINSVIGFFVPALSTPLLPE